MAELGRNWERKILPDGRTELTIHQKPIAYQKNGKWIRITNVLAATGDPNFPTGVDELVQFRLDTKIAGKSPLMYFGKGQSRVALALIGANNVSGVVTGNSVKFLNAWDNADLTYTIAGHRLQKDILLKPGHPASFTFRIDEHVGFDPSTLVFGNDFRILQPVLHAPAGSALDDVPLIWQVAQSGGKWLLTVTLPEGDWTGWVLDPTLTLQPDANDGLDNCIFSVNLTTNYGTLENITWGDPSGANAAMVTLIKFNLSSIPNNATIISATLSLYEYEAADEVGVGSWACNLHRLLRNWVELESTWNIYSTGNNWTTAGAKSNDNDRAAAISAALTLDGTAAGNFVDWTGAALVANVQNIVAGVNTNYGWLLEAPTAEYQGTKKAYNRAYSSDHATAANRPKLVVIYRLPRSSSNIYCLRHVRARRNRDVGSIENWMPF